MANQAGELGDLVAHGQFSSWGARARHGAGQSGAAGVVWLVCVVMAARALPAWPVRCRRSAIMAPAMVVTGVAVSSSRRSA